MLDTDELVLRYAVADRTRPHLRANVIASLDGAATHEGLSGPLNNADDKQVFDLLRMLSDVVLLGAGTLRQEGYDAMRLDPPAAAWRTARRLPAHPTLAVVSARLDLDPASAVFTEAPVRPLVLTHAGAPPARRRALAEVADVVACGAAAVDPARAVGALRRRGLVQVLCEGGPHLLGTLVAADLVDELCLTLSPLLEGGGAARVAVGAAATTRPMRLAHVLTAGDLLLLRYLRAR